MAEKESKENILNANDTFDINELASLNDDITPEFIEQLQNKISTDSNAGGDENLFEEIPRIKQQDDNIVNKLGKINDQIDDNFILKYKAKLKKQNEAAAAVKEEKKAPEPVAKPSETVEVPNLPQEVEKPVAQEIPVKEATNSLEVPQSAPEMPQPAQISTDKIDKLSGGNITEKPITQEQIQYSESLDYLDDNVNYSKYVIYIEPENKEFIESLTVKERKNLINRILKEQDDIAITRKRLSLMQTFIKHAIIAIVTISIAIPIVYTTINASLEASINNYRRSQGLFQTLYKKHGKIKKY